MEKDNVKKKTSIRKGCIWCRSPLITFKEKVLRSCDNCARKTLAAGTDFSQGKTKEGKDKVFEVMYGNSSLDKDEVDKKVEQTLSKRQRTIVKLAKKKGISEEDALQAMKQLKA